MNKEWIVVNMDGIEWSRHATEAAAEAWCEKMRRSFRRRQSSGDQSYLPMSVIHEPCGQQRDGRYSTAWYSPGCMHMQPDDDRFME